ncbi:AAA family ATPase [Campylobacter geochelonis]|uniref:AAA family ATPase n=1 Tax=Campylobacter geochelonis TaxID=1780362 RepID=UPI0007709773|nr:AAA family ATPase [Campylobacter geochelonis]CZE49230.1 DNA repair protein RecN [Campylobacter geochelonis]
MIERLYIKKHITFDECELEFKPGLSVFTGASGAGKSVLMSAILAVFGLSESDASVIEADVGFEFDMGEFGIESEEINTFKMVKEKSVRYFINNQSIAKKNLNEIANQHIKYLSVKNVDEFANEKLLNLLDILASKSNQKHSENLSKFKSVFDEFTRTKKELEKIEKDEIRLEELKQFAKFEIDKIEQISPKSGEFEELMEIKKRLSKVDKINDAWQKAWMIFEIEPKVVDALRISEIDSSFFEDAMNELRAKKEGLNLDELEELNVEKILDRIEALSWLEKRYGGIDEALKTLAQRKDELRRYEDIEFEKSNLEKKFKEFKKDVVNLSNLISDERKNAKENLETSINFYLKELYMRNIKVMFLEKDIDKSGKDEIVFQIDGTNLKNLSSGELNRLRLAFIASNADIVGFGDGVIILDEIDANLSGKEAMSIADVLVKISKFYQIFAISHLPQLSSRANSHFVVVKNGNTSSVHKLDENEKITELARMISGEVITQEAMEFAKKLRNF